MSLSSLVIRYAGSNTFSLEIPLEGRKRYAHQFTQGAPTDDVTFILTLEDLQKNEAFMRLVDNETFFIEYTAGTSDVYENAFLDAVLPPESVSETELEDDAVTTDKILDGAVTAAKLADTYVETIVSVDNTIARFDGIAGALQGSNLVIGDTGITTRTTGTNGATMVQGFVTEATTLSGTTTDTVVQIPAGAVVTHAAFRVTTTITGATTWDAGVAGATNRYADDIALTANTTTVGASVNAYSAATSIRYTANGSDFTGGVIRCIVHYILATAPTS